MSWPVLPRIGEELGIEGNGSRVTEVTHEFYKDTICVYVAVDFNEFEDLAVCDGYTQIFPVIST